MNQEWQTFLTTQGAQIHDGVVQHFGDAPAERVAARDNTMLCDLSQFGTIRVHGEEAQNFLQNLLSSDVNAVTPAAAQFSSFNTAKGRVLATFLIWRGGNDHFLQLPRELVAPIQKKLSMYVLRTKAKVENAGDAFVSLGLSGPNANALVKELVGPPPEVVMAVASTAHFDTQQSHFTVIRLGEQRFQINVAPGHAADLWKKLSGAARPVGSPCWDWLNIRAGIPVILPQTQEAFVPQMTNLDLIGAVNFKKGCYPGQEIVARMQYLGKNKRRMYLAHVFSDALPQPGDELFSTEMEGQACGTVVNAQTAPGGGYDLLAVVQIASHDAYPVHLGALTGARLQFEPLPYPLP
ncbi:CAF17-like 4Fe-4S cluster assembly/insertion protein YgfZ [Sideroxydans lithotrophicus]|uniref:Folate-binding protein YgfZ n=1 Tax=Sideroxydans lithotrophicus (strain ES-1) TaxID=580332 RepID=D5CTC9_SIDLE|nr:folate-binding protein YgfZ [Sideroxydans lithotrophicus]ADE12215.1 folate-binding protein YgfZ [Sideroxydans lithotrophicus ES-1]